MSARRDFFVTGTDTGVGKTLACAALLRRLRESGLAVAGMKPVAAGGHAGSEGFVNEDALLLRAESSRQWPYPTINPWVFEPAIAPHIAAAEAGITIEYAPIEAALAELRAATDTVLIEGAGGFCVPLDGGRCMSELPGRLGLAVILVVGLRLGCLNHARLTAEAIARRGYTFAGWIGNRIDPDFARPEANIATLGASLPGPCLGILPWMSPASVAAAAAALDGAASLGNATGFRVAARPSVP